MNKTDIVKFLGFVVTTIGLLVSPASVLTTKDALPKLTFATEVGWLSPVSISDSKRNYSGKFEYLIGTKAFLNICFKNEGDVNAPVYRISCQLFDLTGNKVRDLAFVLCDTGQKAGNTSYLLDYDITTRLSGLEAGTYICKTILDCCGDVKEENKSDNIYTFPIAISSCDKGDALDNNTLTFETGENACWFGQTATAYDGVDALKICGSGSEQTNWVRTAVLGPGSISFWWYAESEGENNNRICFAIDDEIIAVSSSFSSSWTKCTFPVSSGRHICKWMYCKDTKKSSSRDAGYLDQVIWMPMVSADAQKSFSPLCARWREEMRSLPAMSVPDDVGAIGAAKQKINQLILDAKRRQRNDAAEARYIEDYSKEMHSSEERYIALCTAVQLYRDANRIDDVRRVFEDMIVNDGSEFALAVIRFDQKTMKFLNRSKKHEEFLLRIQEVEWASNVLRELMVSCIEGKADSTAHRKVAQAYIILGYEMNAYAELVCANKSLAGIIKASAGYRFSSRKTFGWLAPRPEMDVADFWWSFGDSHLSTIKLFCRNKSVEWYEKSLKSVKYTGDRLNPPPWVMKARTRIAQIKCDHNKKRKKFDCRFSSFEVNLGKVWFPVLTGLSKIDVPKAEAITIQRTPSNLGANFALPTIEKWYRPSSYWLYRSCPMILGGAKNSKIKVLIISMNGMPLNDEDFDESASRCPTESHLDREFFTSKNVKVTDENCDEWVARYWSCQKSDVILKKIDRSSGIQKDMLVVRLKGDSRMGLVVSYKGQMIFVDFQFFGDEILSEEFVVRFAKRIRVKR